MTDWVSSTYAIMSCLTTALFDIAHPPRQTRSSVQISACLGLYGAPMRKSTHRRGNHRTPSNISRRNSGSMGSAASADSPLM